ncbi:glycine--tRNA ligase [Candidatus Woesearchaeota archaeon]|nr:glycine--tRNA ligase [Candidatus Woesearchaeota archaeon]
MTITIEEIAAFCKRKGFVFPSAEIYNGLSGFFDYGPLGVELKNNIKNSWWKTHVHDRSDVVGIDGSVVNHKKIWEASGHVASFTDVLVECKKCHERYRADHLIEEILKIKTEGLHAEDFTKLIKQNKIVCYKCKSELSEAAPFNMMLQTYVGPKQTAENIAYLRPETAQVIFTNFKHVAETMRLKPPFGIAQIGRAFRNEIAPRNFLFRCREFEQMEIEYFIHPKQAKECFYIKEVLTHSLFVYSAEMQQKNQKPKEMSIKEVLDKKIIALPWHAYWLAKEHQWFISLGVNPKKFRIRQHLPDEKSHYATDTWDLEYEFPFGFKELTGIANRGDYDLKQHMKYSGKDLMLFDEETKEKYIPHVVAEPSQGVDRAFLVVLFDAYMYDKKRENVVLNLHPALAPIKAGVFPLLSNKPELLQKAKEIYEDLRTCYTVQYDQSGSIGKRYARMDEIGTPYCITVDFDSLKKDSATIRDCNTTDQKRVKISDLRQTLFELIHGIKKFQQLR